MALVATATFTVVMKYWNILLNSAWVAATAAIVITGLTMIFMPEMRNYHQNKKVIVELDAEIASELAIHNEYKVRHERFRTEPRYVEQVAHEHGLVYPHEKIFKFEGDSKPLIPEIRTRDRIN